MNKSDREGQSAGRTTGASGNMAEEQQDRTIEGQDSQPGKVWQESDKSRYTGQGDQTTGQGGIRGGYDDTRGGAADMAPRGDMDRTKTDEVNEEIDESQWQGNRFGQGGFGSGGSSNG
jgi:hypothetical protein